MYGSRLEDLAGDADPDLCLTGSEKWQLKSILVDEHIAVKREYTGLQ